MDPVDVLLRVMAPLVGAAVGRTWPIVSQRIRTRRARRFWRPFSSADRLKVVGGAHGGFETFEASGLVGVGDVMAFGELQEIFYENKLGRLDVQFTAEVTPALLRDNDVISLGGPDANWATAMIDRRTEGSFRFGDPARHVISIADSREGREYCPGADGRDGLVDYGILKKVPNPFSPQCSALIIAGSFGFGTWAGVRLTRDKEFLQHPVVVSAHPIECLFRTEVIGGQPLTVTIIDVRPLPGARH